MHLQHMLQLESRSAREHEPLRAAEVTLRAREVARLRERDRAGPSHERERSAHGDRRSRRAPARALGV